MLSSSELAARIAAEFLRVGASQQSWDQNFPQTPSVWVPDASGNPVLSPESEATYRQIAGTFAPNVGSTSELVCPAGTIKEYVNGRWQCTAVGGRVADPEGELYGPPANPVNTSAGSQVTALPPFIGGRLGRVLFTPIRNRQLNGVRIGVLPQVVMGEYAPGSYGLASGWSAAAGGGSENVEP